MQTCNCTRATYRARRLLDAATRGKEPVAVRTRRSGADRPTDSPPMSALAEAVPTTGALGSAEYYPRWPSQELRPHSPKRRRQ